MTHTASPRPGASARPVALSVGVVVTPDSRGHYYVDSADDETGDVYNHRELPPRLRTRALGEADRRELAVLLHLTRTRPLYRVSVLWSDAELGREAREDHGLEDATGYRAELRLA